MIPEPRNKFKDLFCTETQEQLRVLSQTLLLLEAHPDDKTHYATLMRSAHTIKGAAATMGYVHMAHLAHVLEDIFRAGESGTLVITPLVVSAALAAADRLNDSLDRIRRDEDESDVRDVARKLELLVNGASPASETVPMPQSPLTKTSASFPSEVAYVPPTSVRVGVERLDTLMGIFEELLMLRLKLDGVLEPALLFGKTITDPHVRESLTFLQEFPILFGELARLLSQMQEEILEIRLVPLDAVFGQFPRMVRDLALAENKHVTLHIEGGSTLLDRTVLEGLGGALAHLLRNAVDHGITSEGVIHLSALRVGERIHVTVEDNGVGIDYDAVKKVATARGVVDPATLAGMSNAEVGELLFQQNMSTNKTVTEISGRGIGLSAVRAFAQDVGGRVSLFSPTGAVGGTRFLLDLPISLATVPVLLVESKGFTFALPFSGIIRTFTITKAEIVESAHQESLIIDGKLVPLLRLDHLLGITFGKPADDHLDEESFSVVLLSLEREQIALIVDQCVGERELLVKSLPPVLRDIQGFSGSTLLPDGRTILLLDAYGLLIRAFGDILKTNHSTSEISSA